MEKKEVELQNKVYELEKIISTLKEENLKLKNEVEEFRKKEQTISNAIISSMEHANQLEASRKKLYLLEIQRSRYLYLRMEQVINGLYKKYPELKKETQLKDMSERFKVMVYKDLNDKTKDVGSLSAKNSKVDDPIKKLLRNIIDCFDSKKVEDKTALPKETPATQPSSVGFDFNEALHPTMELDEIMKAFNLKNDNDKK